MITKLGIKLLPDKIRNGQMDSRRSMKRILPVGLLSGAAILVICAGCLSVLFQRVNIAVHPRVMGNVIDAQTKAPITNALVQFVGSDYGGGETKSISSGAYDLPPVFHKFFAISIWDVGFYSEVECSAPGYLSQRRRLPSRTGSVYVKNDILHIDFELKRIRKGVEQVRTVHAGELDDHSNAPEQSDDD